MTPEFLKKYKLATLFNNKLPNSFPEQIRHSVLYNKLLNSYKQKLLKSFKQLTLDLY